ncbi:hypothetical protein ACFSSA_03825 [Luteolibacter algae]|uniref:VWFA domain-containing protein n=1 Tax=Luteolibacter algae TaxID=454151 RepID=A0ABW5D6Z7_9BACT
MSIHVEISEEAKKKLIQQKRISTIISMATSVLVIVGVALILGIFLLPNLVKEASTIVTYKSAAIEETENVTEKVQNVIQRKPTAPSSATSKVITSSSPAATAIPTVDSFEDTQSVDFGDAMEFGTGWGEGTEFGTSGGGGATFFNQEVSAERIAYVIDYSASMHGERDSLMRAELTKSVQGLAPGSQFSLIFFSGPAWVAGDKVKVKRNEKDKDKGGAGGEAVVTTPSGRDYDWEGKTISEWAPKRSVEKADWIKYSAKSIKETLEVIQSTPLSYGTDWENPLKMAIALEPPPQIIFFMTDGLMSGRDMEKLTRDLGGDAKKRGITVNTVALMEPKAAVHMYDLAKRTNGVFTIVESGGVSREVTKVERDGTLKTK